MSLTFIAELEDTEYEEEMQASGAICSLPAEAPEGLDIFDYPTITVTAGGVDYTVSTEHCLQQEGFYYFGTQSILDAISSGETGIIFNPGDFVFCIYYGYTGDEEKYFICVYTITAYGNIDFGTSAVLTLNEQAKIITPEGLNTYLSEQSSKRKQKNILPDYTQKTYDEDSGLYAFLFRDLAPGSTQLKKCQSVILSVSDKTYNLNLRDVKQSPLLSTGGYIGNLHVESESQEDTGEDFCVVLSLSSDENKFSLVFYSKDETFSSIEISDFNIKIDYTNDPFSKTVYIPLDNISLQKEELDSVLVSSIYAISNEYSFFTHPYLANTYRVEINDIVINISESDIISKEGGSFYAGNEYLIDGDITKDNGKNYLISCGVYSPSSLFNETQIFVRIKGDIGDSVTKFVITSSYGDTSVKTINLNLSGVTQDNLQLVNAALKNNTGIQVSFANIEYTDDDISMENAFTGCSNLSYVGNLPASTTNLKNCFSGTSIEVSPQIPDTVVDVSGMFNDCQFLTKVYWDVNELNEPTSLFKNCVNLSSIICNNTEKVENLNSFISSKKELYGEDIIPNSINLNYIIVSKYFPNIKIPYSKLEPTLNVWNVNTKDTPYIIDITELTNNETSYLNSEHTESFLSNLGFKLKTLTENSDGSVLKYISLSESADSIVSTDIALFVCQVNSIVSANLSNCDSIRTGYGAFGLCSNLSEVYVPKLSNDTLTIEDGITHAADAMFIDCQNLTTVHGLFNDELSSMFSTFSGCKKLTSIDGLPTGLKVLEHTFYESGITSTPQIPDSVESICSAFAGCEELTEITNLPTSLKDMSFSFQGCTKLELCINIPAGVNNMYYSFSESGLKTTPFIPDTVENMENAFSHCTDLETITNIPKSVVYMSCCFYECTSIESCPEIKTDNPVDMEYAFAVCSSLKSVEGINNISNAIGLFRSSGLEQFPVIKGDCENFNEAFAYTKITTVTNFPKSAKYLNETFENCTNLISVDEIPSGATVNKTFKNCTSLKTIGYWNPKNIDSYNSSQFTGLSNLESITVENEYQKLILTSLLFDVTVKPSREVVNGRTEFIPVYNLKSLLGIVSKSFINDPDNPWVLGVSEITQKSLTGTYRSTTVEGTVQDALKSYPKVYVTLNFNDAQCIESINSLRFAFSDCTNLINITIPSTVVDITGVFCGCTNLKELPSINNNVKYLNSAFSECSSITEGVTIPESTDGDFQELYRGCTSLVTVPNIPKNTVSVKEMFKDCINLETIESFNISYDKFSTMSVDKVENVFQNCKKLTSIGISVKPVEDSSKWSLVSLNGKADEFHVDIYNSSGEKIKQQDISVVGSELKIDGLVDEYIEGSKDRFDVQLIDKLLTYKRPFSNDETALDPSASNFVLWAKDPNKVKSNILNGGGGSALVPSMTEDEYEAVPNKMDGQIREITDAPEEEPFIQMLYEQAPIGSFFPFGGSNAPVGFLMCDGAEYSRATYSDLFAVIGTKYGEGDGETTFNVPSFTDKAEAGIEYMTGRRDVDGRPIYYKKYTGLNVNVSSNSSSDVVTDDALQTVQKIISSNTLGLEESNYKAVLKPCLLYVNGSKLRTYFNGFHSVITDVSIEYTKTTDTAETPCYNELNTNTYIIKALKTTGELTSDVEVDDSKVTTANVFSAQKTMQEVNKVIDYNNYSTEEKWTGNYWIDGKKIYRKVYRGITHGQSIGIDNIDDIIKIESVSSMKLGDSRWQSMPWSYNSNETAIAIDSNKKWYLNNRDGYIVGSKISVILEYTKTL